MSNRKKIISANICAVLLLFLFLDKGYLCPLLATNWKLGARVRSVVASPDGKMLASSSDDRSIVLCDVFTGSVATLQEDAVQLCFSPDSKTLASVSTKNAVKLWDATSGKELRTLRAEHTGTFSDLAFSPDGAILAAGNYHDTTIRLWDVVTGNERVIFRAHADHIWYVAFSPDGNTLASASSDSTIKLWEVNTGKELATLRGHTGGVHSVAFSPDSSTLASGGENMTLKLWDVATGKELITLDQLAAPMSFSHIESMTFGPDGKTLVSQVAYTCVKLWDVSSGTLRATIEGDDCEEWADTAILSSDGDTLVWASSRAIKLCDVASGKITHSFSFDGWHIKSVFFSATGRLMAAATSSMENQMVKTWPLTIAPISRW